jgi:hypothetical protein
MVKFLNETMGMRSEFEESGTTELSFANGDRLQVFAPGHPYYEFFGTHASGPVPLFEVTDVFAAREELEAKGVELVGTVEG